MGWRSHLAAIFGPTENVCAMCGGVNVHNKNCPGAALTHGLVRQEQTKPRLAAVTNAPTRDAFDAWREHPVTQFVFQALTRAAKTQETAWVEQSWDGGTADQALLSELRVRADAYNSMQEGDYEAFCEWAGVTPERADGETIAA